jgi:membrane-associated phospholipid phosphatase
MRRSFRSLVTAGVLSGALVAPRGASAQVENSPAAPAAPNAASDSAALGLRPLAHTGTVFLALETVSAALVFAAYSLAAGDRPETCRWCEPPGFDVSMRNALVLGKDSRIAAAAVSHVLALGVIPAGAFATLLFPALSEGKGSYAGQDAWIMLNTVLLTAGITDGTKKLVGRIRPAFYYDEQNETEWADNPTERNLSFYSGDTAWAFGLASSASTLAFLRGNRAAPYLAIGGGALALGTGYLRVAADVHWTTDVLAGAAIATGLGVAVPLLLHRPVCKGAPALNLTPWVGRATGADIAFPW